ncbi:MAG: methylated-DNA--[protein]-cysteine S-methyltransferase [Alphaproteobacteria bacterium]|jgi:methylated-DNA-[protein]-cysteine S-methyltransferase|nr:methylated-DNA--[protein]-cysteine S-methyltransferase [Alphaproteobacteria bacterium]
MNSGTIDSPFGPITFTVEEGFVTLVKFEPGEDNFDGGDPVVAETARQLREYAAAARFSFDLPLAPAFSDFQSQIRRCMIAIPYGEMRTYGELAKELGSASQAVGQACGANPIPIIIPCHRVVASGGKLGGFSGGDGAPTKKKLLNHEAVYAP